MSEVTADLFERYADLEDELFPEAGGRGSGGGKKKKTAPRDPKSETVKRKREETIEASQENRREEAEKNLEKTLENFPENLLEMYVPWVNLSLESGKPAIDEIDLEEKFVRSGKKAGGQNVNKVSSAVQLKHIPTNISVRNEETRDQNKNRQNARARLESKLKEHLKDWKTYTGDNEITAEMVKQLKLQTLKNS